MNLGQGSVERLPVVEVAIAELSATGSPRASGLDPEQVAALAAAGEEPPPIIVHRATMRIVDGLHRVAAARLRGRETIPVRFFEGGEDEAFVLAVRSNTAHGLPLSLADRKAAAERILRTHPQWSARRIAETVGVSPGTVAEIRRRSLGEPAAGEVRVGRDGRVRPVNGAEGRRIASELIAENPGLSLRQIARAAGISPETVRTLRNRLQRAEDQPGTDRVRPIHGAPPRRGTDQVRTAGAERGSSEPALGGLGAPQAGSARMTGAERGSSASAPGGLGAAPQTGPVRTAGAERGSSELAPGGLGVAPQAGSVRTTGAKRGSSQSAPGGLGAALQNGREAVASPGEHPRDRATVMERLKADPALRYSVTGRDLLRLLHLHLMMAQEWDSLLDGVPPHCRPAVAQLARGCAELWADFALQVDGKVAHLA